MEGMENFDLTTNGREYTLIQEATTVSGCLLYFIRVNSCAFVV
jgi:hypothetical protein